MAILGRSGFGFCLDYCPTVGWVSSKRDEDNMLFGAWLKKRLRKEGPRDNEHRAKAIDQAFAEVPEALAANCFKHGNYKLTIWKGQ